MVLLTAAPAERAARAARLLVGLLGNGRPHAVAAQAAAKAIPAVMVAGSDGRVAGESMHCYEHLTQRAEQPHQYNGDLNDGEGIRVKQQVTSGGKTKMVCVVTNNNATNYTDVDALDLQELLGRAVCGKEEIPTGVEEVQHERERRAVRSTSEARVKHRARHPSLEAALWSTRRRA